MNPSLRFSFNKYFPLFLLTAFLLNSQHASSQKLSKEEHNKKLELMSKSERIDYIISNHYALYSADFDNALRLTLEGSEAARRNKWKDKEAYCEMFTALTYYLKGNFDKALPRFLSAYKLFDSLKHYDGLARLSNEMAVFYKKQKDFEKAREFLDKSEEFSVKANNKTSLGTSYHHRAVMLEQEGNFAKANELYRKVYKIRIEEKDSVGLGYVLLDLANIELRNKKLDAALELLQQSTAIREKIGDYQGVAVNLVNTGETFFSINDYHNAIKYFKLTLDKAIAIGYTDLIRYTYGQLSAAHVALNDYKSAYAYQEKSHAFNDSLFNIQKAGIIAELQEKYESEKKEQEIILQKAVIRERDAKIQQTSIIIVSLLIIVGLLLLIYFLSRERFRKKQQLMKKEHELGLREAYIQASIQSQEDERKRFAQDLHDGMGQLISALRITLLTVNRDSTLDDRIKIVGKAEDLLNDMHREIRSIAFNLMPQTLVQHGLVPALKEMSERIKHSTEVVVRINSFDVPERLKEVQEISLYRVIQEWINNILKYANATVVEVQLVGYETEVAVTVEDNGDGFDTASLDSSKGNGWKNIQSRINLVKGSLEIDSTPGRKGTTLILKVPFITTSVRETSAATVS